MVKKPSTRQVLSDGEGSYGGEEDAESSADDEAAGAQGNMMAYKSVEIDQNLMRTELETIRQHRLSVL